VNVPIYAKNIYDHVKNSVGFFNPGSGLITKNTATKTNVWEQLHLESMSLKLLEEEVTALFKFNLQMLSLELSLLDSTKQCRQLFTTEAIATSLSNSKWHQRMKRTETRASTLQMK